MADKIKESDIIDGDDLWKGTKKSTEELIKLVAKLEVQLKEAATIAQKKLGLADEKDFDSLKKSNEQIEILNNALAAKIKLEKESAGLKATLAKLYEKEAAAEKRAIDEVAKKKKDADEQRLKNAEKLIAQNKKKTAEANKLAKEEAEAEEQKAQREIKAAKSVAEAEALEERRRVEQRNRRIKAFDDFDKKEAAAKAKSVKDAEIAANKKAAADKREAAAKKSKANEERKANKEAERSAKIAADNANAFKRLTKETNEAQAEFKRLAATYGLADKRTQKALKTFNKLDTKLRSINQTARDGRRDVGRYGTAFTKVIASFKNIALGLGVVQIIRGIGRAFADAFRRIREFDKELQNIAGITGTTRSSLKDLEKAIIEVSSSSIRTSNDVAKLATTLFTLGKTKEEVKLLLKPVNDLSIAFGVSSEQAADFLGQTLNAFGKTAKSGQRFADIIANVRTSTALDFERIKDGLGFIAPTASALNLTLGETSALLGVLQDNGIRAARAGRLLNSSFARILDKGLNLEQALEKINKSQDKVQTSSELFGKEALALGLVLADNTEKTAALANEFDNLSRGSLKKLTDEQLGSIDAKIKILDSSYEQFILNIEKGEGRIGKAIKGTLDELAKFVNFLSNGEKTATQIVEEEGKKRAASILNGALEQAKTEEERIGKLKQIRNEALINLKEYNSKVGSAQRELFTSLRVEAEKTGDSRLKQSLKQIQTAFDGNVLGLRETQTRLNALGKEGLSFNPIFAAVEKYNETLGDLVSNNDNLSTANTKVSLAVRERIEEEKLLEAINIELAESEERLAKGTGKKKIKEEKEIIGLINNQAEAVRKLTEEVNAAKIEGGSDKAIKELGDELFKAKVELDRLQRIAFSTREEFEKQQIDLIEDRIDKEIAAETIKSEKLRQLIKTNNNASEEEKDELIKKEKKRLRKFNKEKELERRNIEIEENKKLQLDKFEQTKAVWDTEVIFAEKVAEKKRELEIEALKSQIQARKDILGDAIEEELQDQIVNQQILSDVRKKAIIASTEEGSEERTKLLKEEEDRASDAIIEIENKIATGSTAEIEALQAKLASYTKLGEERIKIETDVIALLEALNEKYFSDQLDKVDRQISDLEKRERNLQDLANRGNEEAAASLAQSQKDQALAARKKEDLLQREKQFELALAIIGAFNTALEKPGATTSTALTEAITSTTVLTSFVQSLPSFFDGTTDTGNNGSLDSNGGHLALLHDNERVVDKKNNMKMGGVTNEDAANIVHDFNNDLLSYNTPQLVMKDNRFDSNEQILSKFDQLSKDVVSAINNKETYLGSDIDTIKKMIIQDYSKGGTRTKVKSKYPTRR